MSHLWTTSKWCDQSGSQITERIQDTNSHTDFAFLRCPNLFGKDYLWNAKLLHHHQLSPWLNKVFDQAARICQMLVKQMVFNLHYHAWDIPRGGLKNMRLSKLCPRDSDSVGLGVGSFKKFFRWFEWAVWVQNSWARLSSFPERSILEWSIKWFACLVVANYWN